MSHGGAGGFPGGDGVPDGGDHIQVEMHEFLCASSVSADSLLNHFSMEGSWPYDFYKPLPGVILSQPSPFYA